MKRKVTEQSLRQGQTVYAVWALGRSSYAQALHITGRPVKDRVDATVGFVRVSPYIGELKSKGFLMDMGKIGRAHV